MGLAKSQLSPKAVFIVVCGNLLEWYDFAVYGYLVTSIGHNFFPAADPVSEVVAAFGAFAVGYIGRFGGALLCGMLSDRVGRGAALRLSVALMAVSTTAIGLLPTHNSAGLAASLLLVLFRLLQGASVGGEFATSLTLMAERSAKTRRGYGSGLVGGASIGGFVLGSAVVWLLSRHLDQSQIESWGWRLPFLLGSFLAVFVVLARRHLVDDETNTRNAGTTSRNVAKEVVSQHLAGVVRTIGGISLYMVGFYVPFVYLPDGLQRSGLANSTRALAFNTGALIALTILSPFAGLFADRFGVKRILTGSSALLALAMPFALTAIATKNTAKTILALAVIVILYAPINATAGLPCTLQFPQGVRGTAFSIGFNMAATLFGGLSPLASELLVAKTGKLAMPSILTAGAAMISIWAWKKCPADGKDDARRI